MTTVAGIVVAMLALQTGPAAAPRAVTVPEVPSVGMPARIEQIVLPGTELEPKPVDDHTTKIRLRIVNSYVHGSAYRYDLEFYGLEPGAYDLRDYLQRKDGSSAGELPALPVTIRSLLPPGPIEPHAIKSDHVGRLGGYQLLLQLATIGWVIGLVAFYLARRRRVATIARSERAPTFADRLRPLVEEAMNGTLSPDKYAELERLLINHWTKRLDLGLQRPGDALAAVRNHPEGGALLRQLESWFHQPPGVREPVDITQLLQPYRDLAVEPSAARASEGLPT